MEDCARKPYKLVLSGTNAARHDLSPLTNNEGCNDGIQALTLKMLG